jgi:hypothetical protein
MTASSCVFPVLRPQLAKRWIFSDPYDVITMPFSFCFAIELLSLVYILCQACGIFNL